MSCTLAICIITYERPELIQSFLEACASDYADEGVDVYFYDSSCSDKTENIVKNWVDSEHIFYIRLPSEIMPNEKMKLIFQRYGQEKEYDFLALSNDSTHYSKEAVHHLIECLNPNYDMVIYAWDLVKTNDVQFFFDKYGHFLLHIGATFLNVHTMLQNVLWEEYEDIFTASGEEEPWMYMGAYFVFYWRRILELDTFSALMLRFKGNRAMRWAQKEKEKTIYDQDIIRYLCESWPYTYGNIPPYYKNRWKACARTASDYVSGKLSDFFLYKRNGLFSFSDYLHYWKQWNKVTTIPRFLLLIPAITPKEFLEWEHNCHVKRKMKRYEDFCKRHKQIFIYGAGTTGSIVGKYMKEHNLHFEAFCATDVRDEKKSFEGLPVYEFENVFASGETVGIVLAMRSSNVKAVMADLKKVGKEHIFYYPSFIADIREEMGYSAYSGFCK